MGASSSLSDPVWVYSGAVLGPEAGGSCLEDSPLPDLPGSSSLGLDVAPWMLLLSTLPEGDSPSDMAPTMSFLDF